MKSLALALALVVTAGPFASVGAATIYDDFDDDSLDAGVWTVINDGSGVTVAEVNQRVEVTLAADAAGMFFGGYRTNAVFSGDVDAEVSFILLDWPQKNGVRVGLSLVNSWPPTSFFNMERVSGGGIEAFSDVYLTDYNTSIGTLVPTTDIAGRLRIARQGDVVSAWYMQTSGWTLLRSETVASGDVSIAFAAWSEDVYFGDQPVRVAFDNASVVPLPGTAVFLLTGVVAAVARSRRRH